MIFTLVTSVDRRKAPNAHPSRGEAIWLTGPSGAGKSTLAMAVEQVLFQRGMQTLRL